MRVQGPRSFLDRYYTSPAIGNLLLSFMTSHNPKVVLDLGAGGGALSLAAYRRWKQIQLITVDIDDGSLSHNPLRLPKTVRHRHIQADAMTIDLPFQLGVGVDSIGAAVCNPPYKTLRWHARIGPILEEAGLIAAITSKCDIAADLIFLAQNIRLVRKGGQIGIIVPDSIIAGEKLAPLRSLLIAQHRIDCVVKLPSGAFVGTEAQAHLLVLSKNGTTNATIPLFRMDRNASVTPPILIAPEHGINKLDYDYHFFRSSAPAKASKLTLREIPHTLVRGSLSSAEGRSRGGVLHLSNFPSFETHPNIDADTLLGPRCLPIPHDSALTRAAAGDILIGRVGRKLENKICYLTGGTIPITDCVYRLRVPRQWQARVLNSLRSQVGQQFLQSIKHGAGAPYICKQDLEGLPVLAQHRPERALRNGTRFRRSAESTRATS